MIAPLNIAELYREAGSLQQEGKLNEAERLYRAVVEEDPNQLLALANLGTLCLQRGNWKEGIEMLDRSLAINPNQPQALNNRGIALSTLHRNEEALGSYESAIELQPDYAEAFNNRGIVLYRLKRLEKALFDHERAIELKPDYADAYNNLGNTLYQLGRAKEAIVSYERAIALKPDYAEAFNNRGNILGSLSRYGEALLSYQQATALKPNYAEAFNNRGTALFKLNRLEEALLSYEQAVALKPDYAEAFNNCGTVLFELKRLEEALLSFDKAIALKPDNAEAFNNRGAVLFGLKRLDEALLNCERALALKTDYAEAFNNQGGVLKELKRYDEALHSYDQAVALKPGYTEAYNDRGTVLFELNRLDEALLSYKRAIDLKPSYAEAFNNLGIVLFELERLDEAILSYERAIAVKPDYAEAFNNRGIVFGKLRRYQDALLSYDQAIAAKPDLAEAFNNRAGILNELKRLDEALHSYEQAFALNQDFPYLQGAVMQNRMKACDMASQKHWFEQVLDGIQRGTRASIPFPLLAMPSTPAQQRRCAEIFAQDIFPQAASVPVRSSTDPHDRIRLGYFSADFHEHPVSYLLVEVFELHDRNKFEVFGFSCDATPEDAMRKRLRKSFDHFLEVTNKRTKDIAAIAQNAGIDIAIDLGGHTKNTPLGIFAHRAAPVQVHFLGYPGTLGTPYIDYLIADRIVIPEGQEVFYSERIAYLPDSFLPSDSKRRIADLVFSRDALGLPSKGFVFCCFNNQYKIGPLVFDSWMRLLKAVEGSVLWLSAGNPTSATNLRKEAVAQGVAAERIVFAERFKSHERHLARQWTADLFLDTFPYNAHTTASDALWAGLPVLTFLGNTFAGRVAASLLTAIGLPEMITHSLEEYEALALDLATQPGKLAAIRQKLSEHRLTYPLFDTPRFTRNIEAAYTQMWKHRRANLTPEDIHV